MSLPKPGGHYENMTKAGRAERRAALLSILDMVRVKIDEGHVDDLLFLMVGPDPEVDGGQAYGGSRGMCRLDRIDLLYVEWEKWLEHVKVHHPEFDLADLQAKRAAASKKRGGS